MKKQQPTILNFIENNQPKNNIEESANQYFKNKHNKIVASKMLLELP